MVFIFFFYGLAFFLMGYAILAYPKKDSSFYLARKLHWVAWFGILHGINEWLGMFMMIEAMEMTDYLNMLRNITLPASFICLVYFGSQVISGQNSKCRICKFITPGLLVIWAGIFFLGDHTGLRWDIWSRYLLCFTGATLTGIALWIHVPEVEVTENFKLAFNLKAAGFAFIIYGVLAGLIVKDAEFFPASMINYSLFTERLGVPVQVLRTVCAILTAYHLIRVLKLFQWETRQAIFNSEYRFKAVAETAPVILFITDTDKKITFIKGRGLESLGLKPADAVGKPLSEVFSDFPEVSASLQKALAGDEFASTVPICNAYYEIFLGPFRSRRGKIQGITGVAVDVTPQKTAQARIDKYRYDMEKNKALAAIGALSTEIARDMIGPLYETKVSLQKASSGLRKTIGAEEVKQNIQNGIIGLLDALKKLDAFCDKANLEKPLEAQPIDIQEITQRILSVFQQTLQRAMVKINIEGTNILPAMNISSRELEQIFYTMIQNVIQSADGVHLHYLDITISIQDDFFCMKFSEYRPNGTGENIDTEQPQERAAFLGPNKYNFELSVLKGITEAYAGTISIWPNKQGGFLHEIRIPVAD
jgi:PAS domain S-box-containing protein